jgi:hypothetical protein
MSTYKFTYSYKDVETHNPKLHDTIRSRIEKIYMEYSYITPDEFNIGAYRIPEYNWYCIYYPPSIEINLPITTYYQLNTTFNKIRNFYTISTGRWAWFRLSPFYISFCVCIKHYPHIRYQWVLCYILFAFLTSMNERYISFTNMLKKLKNSLNQTPILFPYQSIVDDMYNFVTTGTVRKTCYNIAINPDASLNIISL